MNEVIYEGDMQAQVSQKGGFTFEKICMHARFMKQLCVGAQECVSMIEDILEEIYGGSVNYGIQDIIAGIYPVMVMEAGGTCTVWIGIGGSVEHLVCIISNVLEQPWIQGRTDFSEGELITADDNWTCR